MPPNYRVGLSNVGSYQISSIPFVSSSIAVPAGGPPVKIPFPKVSKFVSIRNETPAASGSAPIRVGFSKLGVQGTNYIELGNKESFSGDYRVSAVFLYAPFGASTASIGAGLTMVDKSELHPNWSGSAGVG